jgi:NTE family protein
MATRRALVLGGGGLAGIAWETGVLHGLAEAGLDVAEADMIVGTSAGAAVGAQLADEVPLAESYRRQVEPALQNYEINPTGVSMSDLWEALARLIEEFPDPAERRRQIGAFALAADTPSEPARRGVIAGRLANHEWPERPLAIVAVNATSGERCVFNSASGVELIDAVAASCAVPGVWPAVPIDGSHYIDGGTYSPCNADLAADCAVVLVVTPRGGTELADEVALFPAITRKAILLPDEASRAAFGMNPLDPVVRAPSARAGYAQGKAAGSPLSTVWCS